LSECRRGGPSYPDQRPVADERFGGIAVRQRAANNKVVVAVDENPDHGAIMPRDLGAAMSGTERRSPQEPLEQ
jgi:hypothetical protein